MFARVLCEAHVRLDSVPAPVKLVAVLVLSREELPTLARNSRGVGAAAAIARIIPTNHFLCSSELDARMTRHLRGALPYRRRMVL